MVFPKAREKRIRPLRYLHIKIIMPPEGIRLGRVGVA